HLSPDLAHTHTHTEAASAGRSLNLIECNVSMGFTRRQIKEGQSEIPTENTNLRALTSKDTLTLTLKQTHTHTHTHTHSHAHTLSLRQTSPAAALSSLQVTGTQMAGSLIRPELKTCGIINQRHLQLL